jgi:UrcA family protein
MSSRNARILARTLLPLVLVASVTAWAGPHKPPASLDPPPITVRYEDLNLDTPAGARALYARISTAATKVCGPAFASWYPQKRAKAKECYQTTVDNAILQVNRPRLTALARK